MSDVDVRDILYYIGLLVSTWKLSLHVLDRGD